MRNVLFCATMALALLTTDAGAQSRDVPVRVMLFGDATFTETERNTSDGFSLGQVVGHMNASLAPKLLVFAEATLTPTNGTPFATLERLIVRYDHRDWLKVSAGRYHTPIGWWNTAFHHGSWLQPSIARPQMVRFGTPLVPIHFLGVLAEGAAHTGPLVLAYEAGLGNGRQPNPALPGDAGDDDGSLALVGGVGLRSTAVPGAEFGVHAYRDNVDDFQQIDERILSAHVAFQRELEFIAEYMIVRHTPQDGAFVDEDFDTKAWYVHLGYRLPARMLGLRPYLRLEKVDPAPTPVSIFPVLTYDAVIGGVRWDFADYAAIKAEYRNEEVPPAGDGREDGQSLLLNVSFVIPNLLGGGTGAGH